MSTTIKEISKNFDRLHTLFTNRQNADDKKAQIRENTCISYDKHGSLKGTAA